MSRRPVPRILFNALALRPGGSGVQTYERELLRELAHTADASLSAVVQADAVGELPTGVVPITRRPSSGLRRAWHGLLASGECDLFHGLDVDLPLRPGAVTVSTVHDLSVFDVPDTFARRRVVGERMLVASSVRRADILLAVSSFTAERVRDRFGRECTVIGEAPAPEMHPPSDDEVAEVRVTYELPARFVLHVGTMEPRKNLQMLARACLESGVPLVLAGSRGARGEPPVGAVLIGYVPARLLRALYGAATLVAYPSRYEGFGLPAVEAMACRAPLVASRIPPLVESLGDGAMLVPPGDVEGWSAMIRELLTDEDRRRELADRGHARASRLSWPAVADATVDLYRAAGLPL